jgi:hypothetical protein
MASLGMFLACNRRLQCPNSAILVTEGNLARRTEDTEVSRFSVTLTAALLLGATLPVYANADGEWMDVIHHLALNSVPGGEPIARLNYAKTICGGRTEDLKVPLNKYLGCMKAQGFVFVPDSAAQIAARNKAAQDARNIETMHAIGGALIDAAAAMQPHGCNGQIQPSGGFHTNCY